MIYVYAVISAALIPVLDKYYPILRQSYSLWLVPLIFVAAFVCLVILHILLLAAVLYTVKPGEVPKKRGFYRFAAKISMPLIAKILRIKLSVTGEDLIPRDSRFVIIANHTSVFDPVILMAAFPECELAFMAKNEITTGMPSVVARFITSQGGVFVDREDTQSGARALIKMIKLIKADEASVGIFPEGTRSKSGKLLPFKPGAVTAAAKAGVPLVVCTIKGAARLPKNLPFRSAKVKLDILKCFSVNEIAEAGTDAVQTAAYEMMKNNSELGIRNAE